MNFEKAKNTYRKNAIIQKQMAGLLILNLVKYVGCEFESILEIGSGTGFLTDEIIKNIKYKKFYMNDLTDNFTNYTPTKYIKGDICKVHIDEKFNLIASNAAFQWIDDYNKLFSKLNTVLSDSGIIVFSTFGKNNFSQIKDITGFGLLYPDLTQFILESGFEILYYMEDLRTVYFKTLKELLYHIKFTGVKTNNIKWTKTEFKKFELEYTKKYKDSLGFELTYHPIFYILKKVQKSTF